MNPDPTIYIPINNQSTPVQCLSPIYGIPYRKPVYSEIGVGKWFHRHEIVKRINATMQTNYRIPPDWFPNKNSQGYPYNCFSYIVEYDTGFAEWVGEIVDRPFVSLDWKPFVTHVPTTSSNSAQPSNSNVAGNVRRTGVPHYAYPCIIHGMTMCHECMTVSEVYKECRRRFR